MSHQLISHSKDLTRLLNEGYEIEIKSQSGYLLLHNIPYVNGNKKVKRGTLVSNLTLAGDVTTTPNTHVAMFVGEYPCDSSGQPIKKIEHQSQKKTLCEGLTIDHSFSAKSLKGYKDYYDKMTTYANLISGHAQVIKPDATAKTFNPIKIEDPDLPFNYYDTASSRAQIVAVTEKLKIPRVGIIGVGGTGSYVLDLVAKTPVPEIHIFDGDKFQQHSAFRSPGAPSFDKLKTQLAKVNYFKEIYSQMHKNIFANDFYVDETNLDCLHGLDFIFLCLDAGDAKKPIIEELEKIGVPFIDVGMGINLVDDNLCGVLRVTTSTKEKRNHVRNKKRISFNKTQNDDDYSTNIQIADLNALNAALAVIKWKKLYGFYIDLDNEHFSAFTIDGNHLLNEDKT